jgi:hypothetical protein
VPLITTNCFSESLIASPYSPSPDETPPPAPTPDEWARLCEEADHELTWQPDEVPQARFIAEEAISLEIRGATAQKVLATPENLTRWRQANLWRAATVHKQSVVAKLREVGRSDLADPLADCHTTYTKAVCKHCGKTEVFPNRCDLFYCPECAGHLQKERQRQVEWWTWQIRQPKHVVLTIRNVSDLTTGHVTEFQSYFRKLRRRKFASNWLGGFYRIEVTNEGKGWHLHLHALVNSQWIDQTQLSKEWRSVTNGLGYICSVKDARPKDYLHELTKYVVKGNQLAAWTGQDIVTFILAFQGKRTFGVFGDLYGMRTEFADFIAELKSGRKICDCGCSEFFYLSEVESIMLDLQPSSERPPPLPEPDRQTAFAL